MGTEEAKCLYHKFISKLETNYKPDCIKSKVHLIITEFSITFFPQYFSDGVFGAYMQVDITNDGPVTFEIESPIQQGGNEWFQP